MACGCKKKKKAVPAPVVPAMAFAAPVEDHLVLARCLNCTGLLLASSGQYINFGSGDFYEVLLSDVLRWRSQQWLIEVAN